MGSFVSATISFFTTDFTTFFTYYSTIKSISLDLLNVIVCSHIKAIYNQELNIRTTTIKCRSTKIIDMNIKNAM